VLLTEAPKIQRCHHSLAGSRGSYDQVPMSPVHLTLSGKGFQDEGLVR
jgi:hypothetical protein